MFYITFLVYMIHHSCPLCCDTVTVITIQTSSAVVKFPSVRNIAVLGVASVNGAFVDSLSFIIHVIAQSFCKKNWSFV